MKRACTISHYQAGSPPDASQRQRVIAMVCSTPPDGRASWTVRLIAEDAAKRKLTPQVGWETIRLLLQNHEDLNEQYIAHMEDVLKIHEKPLSEWAWVVCVDVKPGCCTPWFATTQSP